MIYIALLVLLIAIELIYFKIADHFNIIDKPNNRSSHTAITLRGGGIIFPIAIIIAFILGYCSLWVTIAVSIVAIVSFIDDIRPLSQLPRFATHLIAVCLICYDLDLFTQALWLLPIIFILMIGWINAFNFMDGINGITVLYALSAIIAFSLLDVNESSVPLLVTMGLSCIAFGIFNLRKKAKTFAGDVGSISMAVFLGYFMIKTILDTDQIGFILFFAVYGIDAVITIAKRLKKKENIFEAHRSHLYQYLANEMKYSHLTVAGGYGVTQLILNLGLIYLHSINYLTLPIIALILVFLTAIYLVLRDRIEKKVVS
ncbi:UDP-GlcNAc--UDP-phosphate GlcNAc-1-phosphate transferase [Flavobacterium frigidarium]|uniref:UDP-GlcNAc--UDP-phosphate GlcNAc-1-phosphate transferase n=1 Tax=Flavobacterium frigidarium TaxID=99286 RepID=UPI0030D75EA6|tara:strand:+ start:1992 stop:2936 length:945 start_codon:yes stop_codon:yes gene_type:complete